jgi:hypothetical protein
VTTRTRDEDLLATAAALPFDARPAETRVTAFGVEYGHLRLGDGGDLFLTAFGWPYLAQLLPAQWFAERWYVKQGQRLPGSTGHSYHVRTRPADGRQVDLVVKFSRVAQDVPLTIATSFPDAVTAEELANARFNSPLEELGLVMELRRGGLDPQGPRLRTQHPLGLYVPPEEYPLWQLGRSETSFSPHDRLLAEDQEGAARAIELDIRRIYVVLYQWVKGLDAQASFERAELGQDEFYGFAPRVIEELRSCGFRVLDNKPKHFIVRTRRDGRLLRERDGRLAYALVDFELLQRTAEHHRQFKVRQRRRYWDILRHRSEAPGGPLPPHLTPMKLFGVPYLFSACADGGRLWIVGHDPELVDYFSPERWRRTPRLKLSSMNEVFRTRSRDNIHVVYKRSRVGTRPRIDPLEPRDRRIREYGFNSPFEEIAIAELLRQMGLATTRPRAIYRTGAPTTTAQYLRDERRFADHADLVTPGPEGEPVLSRSHDYYTVWDYFRGIDPHPDTPGSDGALGVDLERAREDEVIDSDEHAALVESARRRLRRIGLADTALQDHECLLVLDADGQPRREPSGEAELVLGIDALTAYEYELLPHEAYERLIRRLDQRLRGADCEALELAGYHLLLGMNPDGDFRRDAAGEIAVTLCNFELVRGLYRPLRY